jgi:uroporphyrinogen decarboxylase
VEVIDMNSLERVGMALQHKEADRVPIYPLLNSVARKLVGATYDQLALNPDLCAEAYIKLTEDYDLDVICTLTDLSVEAADFGARIIYEEEEAAFPDKKERLIKSADEYKNIKAISVDTAKRMQDHIKLCNLLVAAKGKTTPIVAFVFGPLGIVSMLRGQEEMFMDLVLNPDEVKMAVEAVTDTLIEYVDKIMDTGVHAVMFDTLYASQSILSKDMWDEFEGPAMERLAKHVHDRGCMVMIHNCGNGIYFDVQIERMKPEAISFLHAPDDCKDMVECKEKYGHLTTLIGCIDPGTTYSGSVEDVIGMAKRDIDTLAKGGGFILSTGCEYPSSLDFEKAEAIIKVGKEYGQYGK